jgi:putative chromate ion transporter
VSGAEGVADEQPGSAHPTFAEATKVWATIGLLSFGGPAGQIALMHKMLVEERKWISEPRFLHALNFCMLLPGPEAQQLATYVGWLLHGTRGGLVAGILFVLPGLAVILVLSALYAAFRETAWLDTLFFGLKAAVLAIVLEAVVRIGRRALKTNLALIIAGVAFLAIFVFGVPFPIIVIGAGVFGYLLTRLAPHALVPPVKRSAAGDDSIADAGLNRVEPTWQRAVTVTLSSLALWAAPAVVLGLVLGFDTIFSEIALFFSWLAVVTFGGAYAVLAYVADAAVTSYGWLNPGEMLDGLAMAETTPGPLIMVLSFVSRHGRTRSDGGGRRRRPAHCMGDLRPELPLDLPRRALHGAAPRQPEPQWRARGDHRGGGRRHPQPCPLARAPCPLSRGRRARSRDRAPRLAGVVNARSVVARPDAGCGPRPVPASPRPPRDPRDLRGSRRGDTGGRIRVNASKAGNAGLCDSHCEKPLRVIVQVSQRLGDGQQPPKS